MNRLTKGLLGVGALLLLSGGLLALSGWTMGGQTELDLSWNGHGVRIGPLGIVSRDSAAQTETAARDGREELHLQAFRRVDVDVDLGDVTVTQGGDYGVSLNWKGKHYALEYELDGDTLRVRSSAQGGRFGLDGYGGTVTVYVPQHLRLEQLEVRSDLGDICLEGIAADTATVTGDLGDLTLRQVRAGELELHERMGTIDGAGLPLMTESCTNQIFPIVKNELRPRLEQVCAFEDWCPFDAEHTVIRFVTCFHTTQEDVDALLSELKKLL